MYASGHIATVDSGRSRMPSRQTDLDLTQGDIKTLERFRAALEVMRNLDPSVQARLISEFVFLALLPDSERSQRELISRLKIKQNDASNDLAILRDGSEKRRKKKAGLFLLDYAGRDPEDKRVDLYEFTPRGKVAVRNILNALRGEPFVPMPGVRKSNGNT